MGVTRVGVGTVTIVALELTGPVRGANGLSVFREGAVLTARLIVNETLNEGGDFGDTKEVDSGLRDDVGLDEVRDEGDAETDVEVAHNEWLAVLNNISQHEICVQTNAHVQQITVDSGLPGLDDVVPTRKARGACVCGGRSKNDGGNGEELHDVRLEI